MTERKISSIGVIGLGYVGLPLAVSLALESFDVVGIDIDYDRMVAINKGECPIAGDEPDLAARLADAVNCTPFYASSNYNELRTVNAAIICVDTPVDVNRKPYEQNLKAVCGNLKRVLQNDALVVIESTVMPGTTEDKVMKWMKTKWKTFRFGVCTERLTPGRLIENMRTMPRVIGADNPVTASLMVSIYDRIVDADLDVTDIRTAEMVKVVENTGRDVEIAFANEMALACEANGVNYWKVKSLIEKLPGRKLLNAGAGVGGHCLPKDPWLLIGACEGMAELRLCHTARIVNDSMPHHIVSKVMDLLLKHGDLQNRKVALMGWSYREQSDDHRNSPSHIVAYQLKQLGMDVQVHDPLCQDFTVDWREVVKNADIAVFMVAHQEYKEIDLSEMRGLMRLPLVIDGRMIFRPVDIKAAGLTGYTIGVG